LFTPERNLGLQPSFALSPPYMGMMYVPRCRRQAYFGMRHCEVDTLSIDTAEVVIACFE